MQLRIQATAALEPAWWLQEVVEHCQYLLSASMPTKARCSVYISFTGSRGSLQPGSSFGVLRGSATEKFLCAAILGRLSSNGLTRYL